MFDRHSVLEFHYPNKNFYGCATKLRPRRCVVLGVRDIEANPLEFATIARSPKRRRGRFLVVTLDLDRQRRRCFYESSMRSLRISERPIMRLGIHDPLADDEPQLFGGVVTDCRADRERIRSYLKQVNRWLYENNQGTVAGLFPLAAKKIAPMRLVG